MLQIKEKYKNSNIIKELLKIDNLQKLREQLQINNSAIKYHTNQNNINIVEFFEEQEKAIKYKIAELRNYVKCANCNYCSTLHDMHGKNLCNDCSN